VVLDSPNLVRLMLQHGADVNVPDPTGRTALMYAAVSDLLPVEQIQMLIEKKADVNAKSQHPRSGDTGLTALDLAKLHGDTPVVDLLLKNGATSAAPAAPIQPAAMRRGNTIQAAVLSSLPLLQRTDASFVPKAGCFSCTNQSLAAMAVALARRNGFAVDEQTSAKQVKVNAGALGGVRNLLHQGFFVPGINANPTILAYVLLGLDAEGYKPTSARMPLRCTSRHTRWRMGTGPTAPKRGLRCARIRSGRPCFPCAVSTVHTARGQAGVHEIDSTRQ